MSVEEKLPLMHDVTYDEAQTMFIDHVRQVVFVDHKIITLQKALWGHIWLTKFNSSYVKEMLVRLVVT